MTDCGPYDLLSILCYEAVDEARGGRASVFPLAPELVFEMSDADIHFAALGKTG